ncbi:hypothetical protein Prudu_010629 [Prunus dulcis]|uniref:Uncharacterized protein n=1 Tax=Prunus dulcis TaxID=3755 RepID=A0A4Y1R9R7_PRUDU|nr:hypothetical protein Prudu_010629 [Prunus dulcis]
MMMRAPPKLPFGMEDVFAEGVRKLTSAGFAAEEGGQPGDAPTGGALSERLLEGVKSDPEAWQRLQLHPSWTGPKRRSSPLPIMAKADKEIQRLKRRDQQAKSKVAEAEEAIREKNALLAQKAALAKGGGSDQGGGGAEEVEGRGGGCCPSRGDRVLPILRGAEELYHGSAG